MSAEWATRLKSATEGAVRAGECERWRRCDEGRHGERHCRGDGGGEEYRCVQASVILFAACE